jgi:hypothetical protein
VAEVKFDKGGFAYLRLYIKPHHTSTMSYLLYKADTGANSTTISKDALHGLGYDDNWIKSGRLLVGEERPSVATGKFVDNCYRVVLPEIRIGSWVGRNWPFLVSLDDTIQFRLLFGTDSMQFFNWSLIYERGACQYEAIPGRRQKLFNDQEQSIHSVDEVKADQE